MDFGSLAALKTQLIFLSVNHFAVGVHTGTDHRNSSGTLKIGIEYANKDTSPLNISMSDDFSPKQSYFRVATSPHTGVIDTVTKAKLTWTYSAVRNAMSIIGMKKENLTVERVEVRLLSLWDPLERKMFSVNLCNSNEKILQPNKPVEFTPCLPEELEELDEVEENLV